MIDIQSVKEIISDFHERKLPDFTPRIFDLSCPESKIRTLIGVRRSGKTYTFHQLIDDIIKQKVNKERILFINFEDERLLPLEVSDLTTILNTYYEIFPALKDKRVFLFFDEIQNVPQWEIFVRRILDTENIQINLTGSSSKLMSREIATSLRGRTLSFEIFPFSFIEYLRFKNIPYKSFSAKARSYIVNAFETYAHIGGFPEILNCSEPIRLKILQDYFNLILYKDLIERHDIRNHGLIRYLLKFLLINNANPFSVNKFYMDSKSQGFKCSKDTLHNYLSYLEDASCFSFVPIFSESVRKQHVHYRKIYAVDHGLVTAFSQSTTINSGRLLETMVYNQLRRNFQKEQICYYKTKDNREIDFVTIKNGAITQLIQVCETLSAPESSAREIQTLYRAMEELSLNRATIITRNERTTFRQTNQSINAIPFWSWCLENA